MTAVRRKRLVDLMIGVPLALLLTPLILGLAVLSALSFRAWPFFCQPRLGRNGSTFTFVKVRSLPAATAVDADKYALASVANTRVGRFLRITHLDELPQLWLVVTGRMSLVGPRPEMPSLAARFEPEFVEMRTRVTPGCTGLWQVSVAAGRLIGEAPEFDRYYVENHTLRLDLWLLARTALDACGLGRPVNLTDVPGWVRPARRAVSPTAPPAMESAAAADIDVAAATAGQ